MKHKILILVESLRINETSSGIGRSKFIAALAKNKNYDITCIYKHDFTYPVTWLGEVTLIPLNNKKYQKNKFIESIPKLRGLITAITGINSQVKFEISKWYEQTKEQLSQNNFSLIITLGSGLDFYPHYAMLRINNKTPWLANFHDPYPISVYPEPYKRKRTIFELHKESFAKKILKKATYLSFPSKYLKEHMQDYYHFSDDKSYVMPHLGLFINDLPNKDEDQGVELQKGRFHILHAGTLLGPRKVDALFEAFNLFIESDPEKKDRAVLNILGKIAKEHSDFIAKHQMSKNLNIVLDRISYKKSLIIQEEANVCLVIEADAKFSPFMPGKLADLIFLEKPILALTPKKSETMRILGEDYPYHSEVNDVQTILKCLHLLWEEWKSNKLTLSRKLELKEYVSETNFVRQIDTLLNH